MGSSSNENVVVVVRRSSTSGRGLRLRRLSDGLVVRTARSDPGSKDKAAAISRRFQLRDGSGISNSTLIVFDVQILSQVL
jgi:hypothetical protein